MSKAQVRSTWDNPVYFGFDMGVGCDYKTGVDVRAGLTVYNFYVTGTYSPRSIQTCYDKPDNLSYSISGGYTFTLNLVKSYNSLINHYRRVTLTPYVGYYEQRTTTFYDYYPYDEVKHSINYGAKLDIIWYGVGVSISASNHSLTVGASLSF